MGRGSYRGRFAPPRRDDGASALRRSTRRLARPAVLAISLVASAALGACERDASPGADGGAPRRTAAPRVTPRRLEEARAAVEQYLDTGRPAEAVTIARKLVEAAPEGAAERELLARSLLAAVIIEGQHGPSGATRREAAEAYREAAALDPANAALQSAAGVALDHAGLVDEALDHYRRAMALDASNAQYPLYAAMAARRVGRTEEALELLDVAWSLAPDEASIETVRAEMLLAVERAEESLAAARRARRLAPGDLQARAAEARALRRLSRPQEAAELLAALPPLAQADEAVAAEYAGALLELGRSRDAARAWERAFEAGPDRWRSAAGAAEAWIAAGDLVRAEAYLDFARWCAPDERRVVEVEAAYEAARRAAAAATGESR